MVRAVAITVGIWLLVALVVETFLGVFQPQLGDAVVLRTRDELGNTEEVVLFLRDDEGQWWVESGHWFRGWYRRVIANPHVQIVNDGETRLFRATPVDTPEAVALMRRLMQKGNPVGYWFARAQMLFAPIKPVRLDPIADDWIRSPTTSADRGGVDQSSANPTSPSIRTRSSVVTMPTRAERSTTGTR